MEDCIFCKIIRKEISAQIIHEDEYFLSFVDMKPANFGHSLIIPKEHHENIYTIPNNILERLGPEIKKLSLAVKKAVNADGINVIVNNEPAAGQLVFHSHTHIVPRFENDGLKWWPGKDYDYPEQMKEIRDKIRNSLS